LFEDEEIEELVGATRASDVVFLIAAGLGASLPCLSRQPALQLEETSFNNVTNKLILLDRIVCRRVYDSLDRTLKKILSYLDHQLLLASPEIWYRQTREVSRCPYPERTDTGNNLIAEMQKEQLFNNTIHGD
jgi:hypothetical protein